MNAIERIRRLPCWRSAPRIRPIARGRTNQNFFVQAGDRSFFARLGVDLPHHGISRANEVRCCRLGAAAGVAPKVVFAAREAIWCETQIHVTGLAGDLETYARLCWDRIEANP